MKIKMEFEADSQDLLEHMILLYASTVSGPSYSVPERKTANQTLAHLLIEDFEFSNKTAWRVAQLKCRTLGELSAVGATEFMNVRGIGNMSANEIGELMYYLNLPWKRRWE